MNLNRFGGITLRDGQIRAGSAVHLENVCIAVFIGNGFPDSFRFVIEHHIDIRQGCAVGIGNSDRDSLSRVDAETRKLHKPCIHQIREESPVFVVIPLTGSQHPDSRKPVRCGNGFRFDDDIIIRSRGFGRGEFCAFQRGKCILSFCEGEFRREFRSTSGIGKGIIRTADAIRFDSDVDIFFIADCIIDSIAGGIICGGGNCSGFLRAGISRRIGFGNGRGFGNIIRRHLVGFHRCTASGIEQHRQC